MRKILFIATILLCAVTQTWATDVNDEQSLRNAVQNGANITVTSNIYLSNSTLSIPTGKKVK